MEPTRCALVDRFSSTNDGRDDGLDKVASDTPAIKKPRVSGQAKTDSVAEELRVLEVKDTSQMSELAIKRHTAAKTKLQLDLDKENLNNLPQLPRVRFVQKLNL